MQLMSIEDLAAYLGDSKRTIYKYIATGDCPAYIRISSKNIKFDRADVDAWLESKKIFPVSGGKTMNDLKSLNSAKDFIKYSTNVYKLPWQPRAKTVLKNAEKHARKDGFDLMGTDHIIFGILSVKDCLAAMVLNNLGITSSSYKNHCEKTKEHNQKFTEKDKLSEDINNVIKSAFEQATDWGHTYIGTEHLLAGILKAEAGVGFQILTELGVTTEKVSQETVKLIVCQDKTNQ
jgi:excisionase family DNA binding protein